MAEITKPIALNESFNTTEGSPRNVADVLAQGIGDLVTVVSRISHQTTYDELSDLEDVNISAPTNGDVLTYDGSKWVNSQGGGGSSCEDMIAPVETSTTASQAYAIGEQFILNGTLYTATAAITAGGTITINGNCTASDSLTEQIDDLQYHVVATSAASGTIASKLSVLAAVYSTLTAEQKMGCIITIADTDFLHNFDIRGLFYGNSMSGSTWIITSLQLNNKKAYSTTNGTTPTDNSSVTNTFVYKLCTR